MLFLKNLYFLYINKKFVISKTIQNLFDVFNILFYIIEINNNIVQINYDNEI